MATQDQRERFEVSPAGYGLHWPDVDEDLSIDGLIGVKHARLLLNRQDEFFVDALASDAEDGAERELRIIVCETRVIEK